MNERILLVDDETKVLQGYERNLGLDYDIATEPDPERALERVAAEGPFAAILSDYKMPRMDGVAFLSRAREIAPDTARLMLTGYADLEKAMKAVNEGAVFRFLSKPCPLPELKRSLDDALRQHQLVTAERELLDKTLKGSVQALLEILSLLRPKAFSLAQKRRSAARALAAALGSDELWSIELAAMLCEIGIVTLPEDAIEAHLSGRYQNEAQRRMAEGVPAASARLLEKIPRLEPVCQIIRLQAANYRDEPRLEKPGAPKGDALPLGSRLLKALNDFYRMTAKGQRPAEALDVLEYASCHYDPKVVAAMRKAAIGDGSEKGGAGKVRSLRLAQLIEGYTLRSDARSRDGDLILRAGQTLGRAHIQRLRNFAESVGIQEPLLVET